MKTIAEQFNEQSFLAKIQSGKTAVKCVPRKAIFRQGDAADSLFFIEKGRIKLGVVSNRGKEAVIGILGPGDFVGEACLAGQTRRNVTASSLSECAMVRIDKMAMTQVLRSDSIFAETFLSYVLIRNIQFQEDLTDQLFNSSEKRLARILLKLANYGQVGEPEPRIEKISQETLAEMVGTTRSRVSYFMNKFRKLGYIEYNGVLEIHKSLLKVVMND